MADKNGHRRKLVDEEKSVSWGGAWTKCQGRECELNKKILFHSDLLKWCLKKEENIAEFLSDTTIFTIRKLALQGNKVKI